MSRSSDRPGEAVDDRAVWPLYSRSRAAFGVATFLFWTSIFVYVPVFPVYIESMGNSLGVVGVVLAAYAIPQLFLRIPVGLYYDGATKGKPIVMLSIVLSIGSAIGLVLAGSALTLFLARALAGIAAAGWVVFTMYYTHYYPAAQSARAIGFINAINQVAILAGTGSGGILTDTVGYRGVFLVSAGLALLSLAVMSFAREPASAPTTRPPGSLHAALRSPLLIAAAGMAVLMQFASFSTIFGFTASFGARIGASSSQLGVITMVTLTAAAVGAFVAVRVAERFSYASALVLGALLLGGALLLIPTTRTPQALALVQSVAGLGRGSLLALLMALSIRSAPAGARATSMGIFQALYGIGSLSGPTVSGILAERFDLDAVFILSAALAFVIAAIALHPAVRNA